MHQVQPRVLPERVMVVGVERLVQQGRDRTDVLLCGAAFDLDLRHGARLVAATRPPVRVGGRGTTKDTSGAGTRDREASRSALSRLGA